MSRKKMNKNKSLVSVVSSIPLGLLGAMKAVAEVPHSPVLVQSVCNHWRTPVKMGKYTVYASGYHDGADDDAKLALKPKPEVGIYFDTAWYKRLTGFVACGMETPIKWAWPFLLVDWPDMGILAEGDDEIVVSQIEALINEGKRVEIACIGGHGRTGTALALLRVSICKMSAQDAIESVRKDYCPRAVESRKQINAVYAYAGEEPPKVAVVSPSKGAGSYGGSAGFGWSAADYYNSMPGYDRFCSVCSHAESPHNRAKDEWPTAISKCAYMRFNEAQDWSCNCPGYVEMDTKDVKPWLKDTSLVQDDKQDALGTISSSTKCECGHIYAVHTLDRGDMTVTYDATGNFLDGGCVTCNDAKLCDCFLSEADCWPGGMYETS